MKPQSTLLLFFLILFYSCNSDWQDVKFTVEIDSDKKLNETELQNLEIELDNRLSKGGFQGCEIRTKGQYIEVISPINFGFETEIMNIRSLLNTHGIEFWNGYTLKDIYETHLKNAELELDGFVSFWDLNLGKGKTNIIGYSKNTKELSSIKAEIEKRLTSKGNVKLVWSNKRINENWDQNWGHSLHVINSKRKDKPTLTDKEVNHSSVEQVGAYFNVNFSFGEQGQKIWTEMTKNASFEKRPIIVIRNDSVIASAFLNSPITSGSTGINNNFSRGEAIMLSNRFLAPPSSVPLKLINEVVLENSN